MAEDVGAMLPDELWVHVFSLLDSHLLLDVVPLVCKRWRRLAGEPRSWASVCVRGDVGWMNPEVPPMVRAILHAPGLRCLNLRCFGRDPSTEDKRWPEDDCLVSALRRCRAVVFHELRVSDFTWLNLRASPRKAVVELVQRSAAHLRRVHLTLSEEDRGDPEVLDVDEETMTEDEIRAVKDAQPDPPFPMLDAVARLKRLEVLHLDVDFGNNDDPDDLNPPQYPYRGQLGAVSLPRLRELVIRGKFGAVPTLLIVELLRAAAPTLEVVKLDNTIDDWWVDSNTVLPAAVQELARCTRIKTLHVDQFFLAALGKLPGLTELALFVVCAPTRGETVRRVEASFAACRALAALRKLSFGLMHLPGEAEEEALRRECRSQADRFSRLRPDVELLLEDNVFCWWL